jgi:hypothetical protein
MKPPVAASRKRAAEPDREGVRVVRDRERAPRLPHDRDESADSQQPQPVPDTMARKAHQDMEAGRVDTDRGPVLQELGRRLPSQQADAPAKKRRRSR